MSNFMRPEIDAIETSGITKVALPYMQDPDVIPLWFGEGDISTPEFIREATVEALRRGETYYQNSRGRPDTTRSIKAYLDRIYDIDLNPARITQPGSSMLAVTIAVQSAVGRGDHCVLVTPNWPNIELTCQIAGAEIDKVRQQAKDGKWFLDVDDVERAIRPDTRLIYVNSPCNPSGWVMPIEDMERLLGLCRDRNILLLSDEVYHRHVFGVDVAPSFMTIARDDDPVIIVNGMSKAWAMTGWRLGWMIAPAYMEEQMTVFGQAFNTGSPSFTQNGLVAALDHGEEVVEELRTMYQTNRDIVADALGDHERVEFIYPDGGFYAFPRIRGMRDSLDFVLKLAESEKVGVAPGYTFGPGNEDHLRIAFACSSDRLREAMTRIVRFIDSQD